MATRTVISRCYNAHDPIPFFIKSYLLTEIYAVGTVIASAEVKFAIVMFLPMTMSVNMDTACVWMWPYILRYILFFDQFVLI